jgi:endonuclease/exonuclease/phosphatase family metal-dependent hydrolase
LTTPVDGRSTFPATLPRHRLDAVFVSPDISVEKYEVIDTDQAMRASDHLPVLADLALPPTS